MDIILDEYTKFLKVVTLDICKSQYNLFKLESLMKNLKETQTFLCLLIVLPITNIVIYKNIKVSRLIGTLFCYSDRNGKKIFKRPNR